MIEVIMKLLMIVGLGTMIGIGAATSFPPGEVNEDALKAASDALQQTIGE